MFKGKDPSRPYKTLQTLMKENGHTYIDVLKVDIEGSEKAVASPQADVLERFPRKP